MISLLMRPHLLYSTLKATSQATSFANEYFPNESNMGNGKANAYKHALWNALIAYYTIWFFRSIKKSILWAKKVTDLHEECFKNPTQEQKMDLANNEQGRYLFALMAKEELPLNSKSIAKYIYLNQDELVSL